MKNMNRKVIFLPMENYWKLSYVDDSIHHVAHWFSILLSIVLVSFNGSMEQFGVVFFQTNATVELLQCETATVRYNKNLITYFFSHCDTYNFYSSTSTPPFHQLPSMSVNQTIRITFFVTSIVGEIINLRTNYAGLLNALVLQLIIVHTFLDRTESLYQWSMF